MTPAGWDVDGIQRVVMVDHEGEDLAQLCMLCKIGEVDSTALAQQAPSIQPSRQGEKEKAQLHPGK